NVSRTGSNVLTSVLPARPSIATLFNCIKRLLIQIVSLFVANLVSIVILSRGRCGLSKCTTCYLVAMSAADLMVVFTDVIFNRIVSYYFPNSFVFITHVCRFILVVLLVFATQCSVWFTAAFTFDRFVAICRQKIKTAYCSVKTAVCIIITVSAINCVQSVPWYFAFTHLVIINNFPFYCTGKASYYSLPIWKVFTWSYRVFTPLVVLVLISLFNSLTIRHILLASRIRRRIRVNENGEKQKDPEMEKRRKSIILLFSISASFLLLWMTNIIYTLKCSRHIFQQTGFMLKLLSSCTNTCIYAVTQSKFREDMKKVELPMDSPEFIIIVLSR
uniref:G-protein coupled receptors family 1 profile domain-containing protein n=1 Tax=Callorhinchus milii TaxID=7868 RepID=A0A4W3J966_CALMI